MARIDEIERRLQNWGRWKHGAGAGGLGYARVNPAVPMVDGGFEPESVVPTIDCDAEETDRAVAALPSELRATVEVYYVLGGGMKSKARRLAVTEKTVSNRVDRAHQMIQSTLAEQERQRRERRRLLERLQSAARPQGPQGGF